MEDVVKLILQFCKEQGLPQSLNALRAETRVSLNAVDSVESFRAAILDGRWDAVLPEVVHFTLPPPLLSSLYEQVVLELIELREVDAARSLLRGCAPLAALRVDAPPRHARLEALLVHPRFAAEDAWPPGSGGRGAARSALADALCAAVVCARPARLVTLLGHALRWQRHTGALAPRAAGGGVADLLGGGVGAGGAARAAAADAPAVAEARPPVRFGTRSRPVVALFCGDGATLLTGSSDGVVEARDARTGLPRHDLAYQRESRLMVHEAGSVSCLADAPGGELVASGGSDGSARAWRLLTGSCVRVFALAHAGSVCSLAFSRDGSQLLSAGADGALRLLGLKSGRVLREMRCGPGGAACACWADGGERRAASVGADGCLRLWDARAGEALACVARPAQPRGGHGGGDGEPGAALLSVAPLPRGRLLLVPRAGRVVVTGPDGAPAGPPFGEGAGEGGGAPVGAAPSPHGALVYVLTRGGRLCAFDAATGRLEAGVQAHPSGGGEALGVAHHPHLNLLATWGEDGTLRLWRP